MKAFRPIPGIIVANQIVDMALDMILLQFFVWLVTIDNSLFSQIISDMWPRQSGLSFYNESDRIQATSRASDGVRYGGCFIFKQIDLLSRYALVQ